MSVVFDRAASFYDRTRGLPLEAERGLADAIRESTELRPGSRVLEVGVGTGRIALPLARNGYRYTGIDLSVEMMRTLRAKPGRQGIDLVRADAARLPFGVHAFDAVVAVHIFHLIDDWPAAMDDLRRVLRPGGLLLHGSNRHAEGDGPWELRRKINEFADPAGAKRSGRLVPWNDIEPQLASRFGEPRQVDTPSWTLTATPRAVIEQLRERIWSHTWNLDDEQVERAARLSGEWAIERWGSLDTPLKQEQHFRWEIYAMNIEQ
jgi:ubiquinone/menaquinone biosynthesis C-methylase UbiE